LYRGDSYGFAVRVWTDEAHTIPGDLAGATAAAELHQGPEVMVFDCTVTDNVVDVEVPAAAWGDVGPGTGRWDLQLTWSDGRVFTVLAGAVTIAGDVTA
jgi:hypothetical protein